MKKLTLFVAAILLFATPCFAITTPSADTVKFPSDTSNAQSIEITLSATPGTITTVTVPNDANGFRLKARSYAIRFAVNASAAAVATCATNDQTVVATDLAVGGIAFADIPEVRTLPSGTSRTVTLRSITASVVVDFEVF